MAEAKAGSSAPAADTINLRHLLSGISLEIEAFSSVVIILVHLVDSFAL
jgi:hypothetical protein